MEMEGMSASSQGGDGLYLKNVRQTLEELQRTIEQHESVLSEFPADSDHHQFADPSQSALASIDIMASAYDSVARAEPFLPFPGSVLPALLALRKTHLLIAESRDYLKSQEVSLHKARRRLQAAENNLSEQRTIQEALRKRIQALRSGLEARMEMTPEQVIKERLEELKEKKLKYDKQTPVLMKAFNNFINDHLDTMLAVEELGGPVVGSVMDIDPDNLEAGVGTQRKPRKAKADVAPDRQQQRLDDIWTGNREQEARASEGEHQRDEALAAGAEMRDLTEQLLNRLMESGGDSSAAYVKIPRESAVTRFLVRSKVAQFHPRDATRIRLVDFGRELDDY